MLKPVTLSNGQVLPAGVIIEIPAYGVTRDEDIFEDANKFDALRFYRLREQSETFNKSDRGKSTAVEAAAHNQFVSVSQNSLTFGYGRHACPGRFFAANEIKMIMARAILTYDIHNVGHSRERYPNIEFGSSVSGTFFYDPYRIRADDDRLCRIRGGISSSRRYRVWRGQAGIVFESKQWIPRLENVDIRKLATSLLSGFDWSHGRPGVFAQSCN